MVDSIWSPDGNRAASSTTFGHIYVWNTSTPEGQLEAEFTGHNATIQRMVWNPMTNLIASGDASGTIWVWNPADGESVMQLTGHTDAILDIDWRTDGQQLVSTSLDNTMRLWDWPSGASSIAESGQLISAVAYSPDSAELAYGGEVADPNNIELQIVSLPIDLTGQITLQAQVSGSSNYALPLTVKLVQDETVVSTYEPTPDATGEFVIEDIPQGTYDIWLKHDKGLAVMPQVNLNAASVPVDFGTLLMGDANNDNVVNLTDFSLLSSSYGKSLGQAGYDARADFNGDNVINLIDFSLLADNFDLFGIPDPEPSGARIVPLSAGTVDLTLNPDVNTVTVGQEFDVTVRVEAGEHPVDGAAAVLKFDPALLEVVSVTPGTSLAVGLSNSYDNVEGRVSYAAGALEAVPSGTFDLVTVRFRALAETKSTGITFVSDGATGVTYAGESVLNATEPAGVTITN